MRRCSCSRICRAPSPARRSTWTRATASWASSALAVVLVAAASHCAAAATARARPSTSALKRADAYYHEADIRHALPLYSRLSLSAPTAAEMQWAILHAGLCQEALCQDSLAVATWRTGMRRFPHTWVAREMAVLAARALARLPGREAEADVALSEALADSSRQRDRITAMACLARADSRLARMDTLGARADLADLAKPHATQVPGIPTARALLADWPTTVRDGMLESAVRAWQGGDDSLAVHRLIALVALESDAPATDPAVTAARRLLARTGRDSAFVMPWLGFRLETASRVVRCADADSAVSGDVRVGDRITSIAGHTVRRDSDVLAAIASRSINAPVRVALERAGRTRTVTLIVSSMRRTHAPADAH